MNDREKPTNHRADLPQNSATSVSDQDNGQRQVNVSILGKSYQVNCPKGRESELHDSAFFLDQKMQQIRNSGRIIGLERIAVMAALNISYELLDKHHEIEHLERTVGFKLKEFIDKMDTSLEQKGQLTNRKKQSTLVVEPECID